MKKLINTLNKFLRTEAGTKTIIMGDFNLDFRRQDQDQSQDQDQ